MNEHMEHTKVEQGEMQHINVELLGHKGEIEGVFAQAADGLWLKEDRLFVWVRFEEAVESTLSFAVGLPLKPYGKDELLRLVKSEGEKQLTDIIEKDRQQRTERKAKELRESYVNSVADQVKASLGQNELH